MSTPFFVGNPSNLAQVFYEPFLTRYRIFSIFFSRQIFLLFFHQVGILLSQDIHNLEIPPYPEKNSDRYTNKYIPGRLQLISIAWFS